MVTSVRRSLKGAFVAGVSTLLLPAAQAAGPVFDGWSVEAGQIIVQCPTDYKCETVSQGSGFVQVQLSDTSGNTFIQTVITDQSATSATDTEGTIEGAGGVPYSDESFIQLGNVQGIKSKQHTLEGDPTVTGFETTSEIRTGWAQPASGASMIVNQNFRDEGTAADGDTFSSNFTIEGIHDRSGVITDRKLVIDQTAELGQNPEDATVIDKQRYVLQRSTGLFTTAPGTGANDDGSVTLATTSWVDLNGDGQNNTALDESADQVDYNNDGDMVDIVSEAVNGGSVDWVAGDDVMLRWIGQSVSTGVQGSSIFGFEGVTVTDQASNTNEVTTFSDNRTGIADTSTTDPLDAVSPFDWDALFGDAPTL